MNCYQLILSWLHPETPVFATIYCLRSGHQASYALEGEAKAEFERDVVLLADTILDTDFAPLKPVRIEECTYCDFLSRCSRYWQMQSGESALDTPHFEE